MLAIGALATLRRLGPALSSAGSSPGMKIDRAEGRGDKPGDHELGRLAELRVVCSDGSRGRMI
jgi:hypothetical protein